MTIGRLAVLALAAVLALGGIGTAFAALSSDGDDDPRAQAIELRKDDAGDDFVVDDEGDGDDTRGDDGTGGGDNTGDGDRTRGNDGTGGYDGGGSYSGGGSDG
jgi:hypothetical protein